MNHEVFISHSSIDKEIANAMCEKLESSGVECWIAPRNIMPGADYAEGIINGIEESSIIVLIISSKSNDSPQVLREVERAVNKRIPIVPFRIEDVVLSKSLEYFISSHHWLDASSSSLEKCLEELVETVKKFLNKKDQEQQSYLAPLLSQPKTTQTQHQFIWKKTIPLLFLVILLSIGITYYSINRNSTTKDTNYNKSPAKSLTTVLSSSSVLPAQAALKTRIAVLPIYTEKGIEVKANREQEHYRRMMGFINRELVGANFEVLNPFAQDAAEKELNKTLERAKEDSLLVSGELCHRYGLDAVIVVKLDVSVKKTSDGSWKARAEVYLEGYDSARRDLGIADDRDILVTKSDRARAIKESEKEIGSWVGRVLTAWGGNKRGGNVVSSNSNSGQAQGGLAINIRAQRNTLELKLIGANEEELAEVFGKVLNSVRGVVDTRIAAQEIIPNEPQRCFTLWRVEIDSNDTDTFRLKTNINKMINDILDAGGYIKINGVPYRYSPSEVKMMQGFRSSRVTANSIQFVIDRDRARERDLSNTHDPYNAKSNSQPGFD